MLVKKKKSPDVVFFSQSTMFNGTIKYCIFSYFIFDSLIQEVCIIKKLLFLDLQYELPCLSGKLFKLLFWQNYLMGDGIQMCSSSQIQKD